MESGPSWARGWAQAQAQLGAALPKIVKLGNLVNKNLSDLIKVRDRWPGPWPGPGPSPALKKNMSDLIQVQKGQGPGQGRGQALAQACWAWSAGPLTPAGLARSLPAAARPLVPACTRTPARAHLPARACLGGQQQAGTGGRAAAGRLGRAWAGRQARAGGPGRPRWNMMRRLISTLHFFSPPISFFSRRFVFFPPI